ncbi:unnamed protein product [Brassicogethes aeneus]|uniref:Leucine-rich repeat-containing protein 58 n=1 Tax=Brassicogethes aeneus TaxID=1431903 RepID=A0A9P0FN47_BRAAE|nr:unnamed protein product [Brassicogethes aeneus]
MENYTSDSSDSENNGKVLDYAYLLMNSETVENRFDTVIKDPKKSHLDVENIILHHNQLNLLPVNLNKFSNMKVLDVSNNGLTILPDVFEYCSLTTLIAKNNSLSNDSLPKSFNNTSTLRELNLNGNQITNFPEQILEFTNLKFLYLGGNGMLFISKNIYKLQSLQVLSFGGNNLTEVPATLGHLKHLYALILCDNKLEGLPANIANLHNLKSLMLHKNHLRTLPPEIVALKNLTELSLRENPLVVRFVSDMSYNPGSLLELSARSVKSHNMDVKPGDVPLTLLDYLNSAHHCVNPNCKGVFFNNRVEHIKFVDFCGKYRIPLLQYLCSSKCANGPKEDIVRPSKSYLMKKVLLG